MENSVMFKLTYGLFVLSVNVDGKDNACIINTATQVASLPNRICVSVNKGNYTAELIRKAKGFTVSVISEEADFSLFKRFGFCSGRDINKFEGLNGIKRLDNGTIAVTKGTNAYLSVHIENVIDLDSHILVVGIVSDGENLSDVPSATYAYYQSVIKPKPQGKEQKGKTVWRCTVCGYTYEGENLPENFVCPICKHGTLDFEKVI